MDEMIAKANGKKLSHKFLMTNIGGYDEVRALEKENKLQEMQINFIYF